jgi:DNA-binding NtrC family response regulator
VRELVNIVERLLVLNGGSPLDLEAVRRSLPELALAAGAVVVAEPAAATASQAIRFGDAVTLDELERQHILATLERVGGNKQEAADRLGIARRTLWDRLERYRAVAPESGQANEG